MEVTARRAFVLASAAIEAATKTPVSSILSMSIYSDTSGIVDEVAAAQAKLDATLDGISALLAAGYTIRKMLSDHNQKHGISALLAEDNRLKNLMRPVEALLSEMQRGDSTEPPDVGQISALMVALRKGIEAGNSSRVYGNRDYLKITLGSDARQDGLRKRLAALRRDRAAVADELSRLNSHTTLVLPADVVEVLTKHDILA